MTSHTKIWKLNILALYLPNHLHYKPLTHTKKGDKQKILIDLWQLNSPDWPQSVSVEEVEVEIKWSWIFFFFLLIRTTKFVTQPYLATIRFGDILTVSTYFSYEMAFFFWLNRNCLQIGLIRITSLILDTVPGIQ